MLKFNLNNYPPLNLLQGPLPTPVEKCLIKKKKKRVVSITAEQNSEMK